eukprot:15475206-Alexandrium_andersonii.AAC.1
MGGLRVGARDLAISRRRTSFMPTFLGSFGIWMLTCAGPTMRSLLGPRSSRFERPKHFACSVGRISE